MTPIPEELFPQPHTDTSPGFGEKMSSLVSIMVDISSELELDELFKKIVHHATHLCEGDGGLIALVAEDGSVTKRYAYNVPDAVMVEKIPRGRGTLYEVLRERRTIIVDDYATYPMKIEAFAAQGIKSVLATPIMRKNRLTGVIEIFSMTNKGRIKRYGANLLETVAAQAAVALENASLYDTQRQHEEELAETLRIANILIEAANVIGSTLDTEQVLKRFSDLVAEITKLKRNVIFLYDPVENTHEVIAEHNGGVAVGAGFTVADFGAEFFEIYRSGLTTVLDYEDPGLSPAAKRTMDGFNAKTGLFVPLTIGDRVIGSIGIDNPGQSHKFTDREIELASGLAKQAAVAIENARLFERVKNTSSELEERGKDLQTLLDVTLDITGGLKLEELMYKIAKNATELIGADVGAVGLFDKKRGVVTYPFVYNLPEVLTKVDVPLTSSMTGLVIEESEPLIIDDYQQLKERVPVFAEAGLRAIAMVPLTYRGEITGTLWVSSRRPEKHFDEHDISILDGIALHAAIALENSRLYESVRQSEEAAKRRTRELSILNDLSNVLSQTLDLDTMLKAAIDSMMELLEADGAAIYILDEEKNSLRLGAHKGLSENFVANSRIIPVGERLPGRVVETGHSLIIENLADSADFEATVVNEAFASLIGAPIKSKGKTIGSFPLGSRHPGKFSKGDATLLESIGNELGVAMENSRLYAAQLNIAESLQRSMLPAFIPSIPGAEIGVMYSSATEEAKVGGDFYDIFDIDGRFALIIGDVSGKGIAAAAYTSMVKYALRAYLYQDPSPAHAISQVNGFVRRQVDHAVFITAFCAIYEPETGVLAYVNAGHPYPCLLDNTAEKCTFLTTNDPAIGIIADYAYREKSIQVRLGNLLVAYTDGVLEARADSEFFGEGRLEETLLETIGKHAQETANSIIDACLAFSRGRLTDDIALLVMKRTI